MPFTDRNAVLSDKEADLAILNKESVTGLISLRFAKA
jgi:hypothetical protein